MTLANQSLTPELRPPERVITLLLAHSSTIIQQKCVLVTFWEKRAIDTDKEILTSSQYGKINHRRACSQNVIVEKCTK